VNLERLSVLPGVLARSTTRRTPALLPDEEAGIEVALES
jgi:hypothetical protein